MASRWGVQFSYDRDSKGHFPVSAILVARRALEEVAHALGFEEPMDYLKMLGQEHGKAVQRFQQLHHSRYGAIVGVPEEKEDEC